MEAIKKEITNKNKEIEIKIHFKENNFILGTIGSDNIARIGVIFVERKYRGKGISQKLLAEFINEIKKYSTSKIAGFSTHPAAIKFAVKLLGKDNLKITTLDGKAVSYIEAVNSDHNYIVEIDLN